MIREDFRQASLVPELLVSNLDASLSFWCGLIGFTVAYERSAERFTYLALDGAQVTLEEYGTDERHWITGDLTPPLGRGVNFQIDVPHLGQPLQSLKQAGWPLFMEAEENWYQTGDVEIGVRQFLVQDPDGYLLRLAAPLGQRQSV
ncbi:bleomycin resistance protein [Chelativorans salis]|uniref:Bleomycin resistance protein n=1 Tax=Chelativorans salis TaxID=2978478 RepID=A0ABT2LNS7_9HYPH|nr:VOC family protein [Chelativorans sp. EGI FJ00035]MCT7376222.1 VOC family protein [Chelativorans sp. EGI FJ00035]